MTYNDIHKAIIASIRSVTGISAVSLENDKDEDMRGRFKLVEDEIKSSRTSITQYRTTVSYLLGYFPKSDEYKQECIAFLEKVQGEFLCRGVNVPNEAHIYIDDIISEIDTEFPCLIMTFDASVNFAYSGTIINEDEDYENMESLEMAAGFISCT